MTKLFQLAVALSTLFISTACLSETVIKASSLKLAWESGWIAPGHTVDSFAWVKVGTTGTGNPLLAVSSFDKIDLRKKIINYKMRIPKIETLKGIEIRFSNDSKFESFFAMRVLYYSQPDFNIVQANEWHNLSFGLGNTSKVGNPNPSRINHVGVFLMDDGEEALTFDISDISISKAKQTPILTYTFDDGYDDNLLAAQILKKHNQTATAYIIPDGIGKPGYMTLADISRLKSDGWGISSHDALPFTERSPIELKERIDNLDSYFKKNDLSEGMRHLAYPLGQQNRSYVLPMTRSAYHTARVAGGGMETLPPGDYLLLRTFNVLNTTSVEEIRDQVRLAKQNNQWLILMFHYLHDNKHQNNSQLSYHIDKFRRVVKMVSREKIKVAPIHKVYQQLKGERL
jgi:peptidoglycan/xylan/chitin deacetylase (PgdA/CDA1 family)